jgi:hypothetical protein
MAERFPLQWPAAYPRTNNRERCSRFKARSFLEAVKGIYHELELLGAQDVIVSTSMPLRRDGMPYSDPPRNLDPGVAVYFKLKGSPRSMACDKWDRIEHNAHALSLTIEAMRGLDRWGASQMLDRVFQGFTALPAPAGHKEWWRVLQCRREDSVLVAEAQYRTLLKQVPFGRGREP